MHPAHRSALIIKRRLPWASWSRAVLFAVSTVAGIAGVALAIPAAALIAFVSTILSQVIERYCFFATCSAPRMPGGIPT
jgi:hypothetical protein